MDFIMNKILHFLNKKYQRFFEIRKIFELRHFIHRKFKEKDLGSLGLDFSDKPIRQDIVQKIIDKKKYKNYLEIGCNKDELFSKIICENKIGVDPIRGGNLRITSDKFFQNNNNKFDCIFIDGLHKYHQVRKDIINSLEALNENGIILLHDCLPNDVFAQAVPRCQHVWNGDVWKALVEFRTHENLDVYTCYADHGIGVIFNRKNKNLLKIGTTDFHKLKFEEYFNNYKSLMNVISFEELLKVVDL